MPLQESGIHIHNEQIIQVPSEPERSYPVHIGRGILGEVMAAAERLLPGRRPFVVTDVTVAAAGHLAELTSMQSAEVFTIEPAGERSKTIGTVEAIIAEMERKKFGRDSMILALGGGTVGDAAGFAAAIFKRGIPVVQIPTTTVAQADSAVGGKTGVDSTLSKNAYGAFHHPSMVAIDVATLRTLDERHYRAGLVESVKHGMIADAEYFDYLESHMESILARDGETLIRLAGKNCAIKGRVVFKDPREKNLRRILNFGHTLGHAVETASDYALLHGESVAIGIVAACRIGELMGICPPNVGQRASTVLNQLGQPLKMPAGLSASLIRDALARDKKAVGSSPRFVLLENVGAVHAPAGAYAVEVPTNILKNVLTGMAS